MSTKAIEAIKALLRRDEANTCQHDETHRGGSIWEICGLCGMKWADDRGGKPKWRDPTEWDLAREALAELEAQGGQAGEPVKGAVLNRDGLVALVDYGKEDWHIEHRGARRLYTHPQPSPSEVRDAQRLRYLLANDSDWSICEFDHEAGYFVSDAREPDVVRAAIDAALAAQKEGK